MVQCSYCLRAAVLRPGYRGKPTWFCDPCDARVGCHPETNKPLGSLANAELRQWRQTAHEWFDPMWRVEGMPRSAAYRTLGEAMSLPAKLCHIAMFDVEQCRAVVQIATWLRRDAREAA